MPYVKGVVVCTGNREGLCNNDTLRMAATCRDYVFGRMN